jgi:hypothetical protein
MPLQFFLGRSIAAPRTLTADAGSFSLTGNAAALGTSRVLTASAGSFVLTGQDASLEASRVLSCSAGVFTLTGNQAALVKVGDYELLANAGSFVLTGNAADLRATRVLSCSAGVFTLTGNAASLNLTRAIVASVGTFSLSGQAADLRATRVLTASAGAFVLTGNAATLVKTSAYTDTFTDTAGTLLTAHTPDGGGTWTKHVGNDVVITAANRARQSGTVAGTGIHYHSPTSGTADYDVSADVVLRSTVASTGVGVVGPLNVAADDGYMARYDTAIRLFRRVSGTFTQLATSAFTPTTDVPFRITLRMTGSTIKVLLDGSEVISYSDATPVTGAGRAGIAHFSTVTGLSDSTGPHLDNFQGVPASYALTADPGSFSLSGNAATLEASRVLTASAGSFTLSGQDASLEASRVLAASAGTFVLTGNQAALVKVGDYELLANAGSFSLTGNDADLLLAKGLDAELGTFSLAGNAAGLIYGRIMAASPGAFVLTGNAANLAIGYSETHGHGELTWTRTTGQLTWTVRNSATTLELV